MKSHTPEHRTGLSNNDQGKKDNTKGLLKVILGLVVMTTAAVYLPICFLPIKKHKMLPAKLKPAARSPMSKWEEGDDGAREAERIISLYLKHRKKGMERKKIAKHIFNLSMPGLDIIGHEDSYPFLSGDTLRAFADAIYEGEKIGWKSVYNNNSSWKMLDHPDLICWLAQNPSTKHAKLLPVPVGLENQRLKFSGEINVLEHFIRNEPPVYEANKTTSRDIFIYINFSPKTNKLRPIAQKSFRHIGTTEKNDRKKLRGYFNKVIRSKFVLSPPGVGEDCHRTWESVLLGAIPIVYATQNSTLRSLFRHAPVYMLDKWVGVNKEQFLHFQVPTKSKKLILAQYWFDLIDSYRAPFRKRNITKIKQE